MYILLKGNLPDKLAPVVAAHASLACYRQYESDAAMQEWINSVFKKVVCRVDEAAFEQAKSIDRYTLLTESSLSHAEVALAFCPREEYPKAFQFFKMWMPG